MGKFLTRERFGRPQIWAGFLLLAFLLQCGWLLARGTQPTEIESSQLFRVVEGLQEWSSQSVAGTPSLERMDAATPTPPEVENNQGYDANHSPLWYLLASAPLLGWSGTTEPGAADPGSFHYWGWLARAPYLIFGVLLGASLWYVARRLYGNAGGYIALTLYCFSPAILRSSTLYGAEPEMGAAWGAFGAVFTAIAVAHTIYAPREVVLWNWRRILLLGLSLTLVAGDQFSLAVLAVVILPLMLWVAPVRPRALFAIWTTAVAVGMALLFAAYFFEARLFWQGMRHALWIDFEPEAFGVFVSYRNAWQTVFTGSPALMLVLPAALIGYLGWKRARYFGNAAPLLMALLMLVLAMGASNFKGQGFYLCMLIFLFVFVAGVFADLLETSQSLFVMAALVGLLSASAIWNVCELARLM